MSRKYDDVLESMRFMILVLTMCGFAYTNSSHTKNILSRIDEVKKCHESLESLLVRQNEEILELRQDLVRTSESLTEK